MPVEANLPKPSGEDKMRIGMIGLGRMGMNMARRLLKAGHQVVAYNRTPAKTEELAQTGGEASYSLAELVAKLAPPPGWYG